MIDRKTLESPLVPRYEPDDMVRVLAVEVMIGGVQVTRVSFDGFHALPPCRAGDISLVLVTTIPDTGSTP